MDFGVINRLLSLGYEVEDQDNYLLEHIITKVNSDIIIKTGLTQMPLELNEVITDRICGEYIKTKYLTEYLDEEAEDTSLKRSIKSIAEGDLKVTFSDEEKSKVIELTDYLINENFDLTPFRCIKW